MYDLVIAILRSAPYNWQLDCRPAPDATAKALGTLRPEEVASRLDAFCRSVAAGIPDPYGQPNGAYLYVRHKYFAENVEFWETNTAVALGLIHEIPVPRGRQAKTVDEWWDNQNKNLNYLGYGLLSLDDPNGVIERDGRLQAAQPENVPFDWAHNGLGVVYQLLTREGLISLWRGRGYFGMEQQYEGGDFRRFLGMTPQMVLDNLWAARRLTDPRVKWLVGGKLVEGWED